MSGPVKAIHKQTFRLHSYEVDQHGLAHPDILMCFMLDSAWAHAKDTEFSYSGLKDEGQLWVLSRFLAVFHDMPRWDDEITVETWGKGTDKLFGLRDFVIHSQSGKKLVSATSAWLIIDRKVLRIQRIDMLKKKFPMQLEQRGLDVKLEKIEERKSDRTELEYIVRYSDLDVNQHVNSSKYVQWILDSFPADFHGTRNLKSLEVNFLIEAKLGDRVFVSRAPDRSATRPDDSHGRGKYFYCGVKRENDNVELCRAKVVWD